MRRFYLIALILTLAIAGVYWYRSTAYICPAPIAYKVGNIDGSFNITLDEAKQVLAKAEVIWETSVDRELFYYDESAALTVDFVFDERQQMADSEEQEQSQLDKQREASEKIESAVNNLRKEQEELSSSYRARADAYEVRLNEYNQEVGKYNDRGGAPPPIFEQLETTRLALSEESEELNDIADKLNSFTREINELNKEGNELVKLYNQEVEKYNKKYGADEEFTQGDYKDNKIRIYKFSSENELVRVLTHEFGHALGIGHVEGDSSVMYYLLEEAGDSPTLSSEDTRAFYDVCGEEDSNEHKIRRFIRKLL